MDSVVIVIVSDDNVGEANGCHARSMSKGVILQNPHTLHISKAEAQRAD